MKRSQSELLTTRVLMLLAFVLLGVSGAVEIVSADDQTQATSHAVFGGIFAVDGSALPGVHVSLSGDRVNQKTVSDGDGAFQFTSVPPGDYSVMFKMKGMKKVKLQITVSTGDLDMGEITMGK